MKKKSSWESTKVYDWKNYVIPARPSASELDVYEEYIRRAAKKKKSLTIAILGSTVEFRSLCHKYNAVVTIIEFSKRHYEVLSRQPMQHKGKETVREEDWRTMQPDRHYDLILGDLVLNVVQKKDIGAILRNLKKSLSPGGSCILRTWVRKDDTRRSIEKVLQSYRRNTPRLHFYTANIMPLYMCSYDFRKDNSDYPGMIALLKKQLTEKKISKKEYLSCYLRWKHEGSAFTIPLKNNLEALLSRFFGSKKIRYGSDSFKAWAPMYILRKK